MHDSGWGSTFVGCHREANGNSYQFVRDCSTSAGGGLSVHGGTSVGPLLKYEHFDRAADGVGSDTNFPDLPGLGSPVYLPVVVNGSFDRTLDGWTTLATHATATRDTSTVFGSSASLKLVHSGDGQAHWVAQAFPLTPFLQRQVYVTAMVHWTTEYPSLYLEVNGINRFLSPIVDFGDGWQLWGTSANITVSPANFSIKQTSSVTGTTCYVTDVAVTLAGYPSMPSQQAEGGVTVQGVTPGTPQAGNVNLLGTLIGGIVRAVQQAGLNDAFLIADASTGTAQVRLAHNGTPDWSLYTTASDVDGKLNFYGPSGLVGALDKNGYLHLVQYVLQVNGVDKWSLYVDPTSGDCRLWASGDQFKLTTGGLLTVNTLALAAGAVTYGANDSGGAGYRLMRVPNA